MLWSCMTNTDETMTMRVLTIGQWKTMNVLNNATPFTLQYFIRYNMFPFIHFLRTMKLCKYLWGYPGKTWDSSIQCSRYNKMQYLSILYLLRSKSKTKISDYLLIMCKIMLLLSLLLCALLRHIWFDVFVFFCEHKNTLLLNWTSPHSSRRSWATE